MLFPGNLLANTEKTAPWTKINNLNTYPLLVKDLYVL